MVATRRLAGGRRSTMVALAVAAVVVMESVRAARVPCSVTKMLAPGEVRLFRFQRAGEDGEDGILCAFSFETELGAPLALALLSIDFDYPTGQSCECAALRMYDIAWTGEVKPNYTWCAGDEETEPGTVLAASGGVALVTLAVRRCPAPAFELAVGDPQEVMANLRNIRPMAPNTAPTSLKPTSLPVTRQTTTPVTRPITRPTTRPATRPTARPTTKPTARPATRPTSRPTTRPTTRPTARPATRPITRSTTRSPTRPITRPTTRPTARQNIWSTTRPTRAITSATGTPTPAFNSHPVNEPQTTESSSESTTSPTKNKSHHWWSIFGR